MLRQLGGLVGLLLGAAGPLLGLIGLALGSSATQSREIDVQAEVEMLRLRLDEARQETQNARQYALRAVAVVSDRQKLNTVRRGLCFAVTSAGLLHDQVTRALCAKRGALPYAAGSVGSLSPSRVVAGSPWSSGSMRMADHDAFTARRARAWLVGIRCA